MILGVLADTDKISPANEEDDVLGKIKSIHYEDGGSVDDVCDTVTILKGSSDIKKNIAKLSKWKNKPLATPSAPSLSHQDIENCVKLFHSEETKKESQT